MGKVPLEINNRETDNLLCPWIKTQDQTVDLLIIRVVEMSFGDVKHIGFTIVEQVQLLVHASPYAFWVRSHDKLGRFEANDNDNMRIPVRKIQKSS